jgi:hypothetical protein
MSVPKRIQLKRAKGWRKPEGVVVVSRPSKWGNPFPVSMEYDIGATTEREARALVVQRFESLINEPEKWSITLPFTKDDIRAELRGHDLACWCSLSAPCHADVLLRIANWSGVTDEISEGEK